MVNNESELVILATQRSGSTMVCDDMDGTGVLGHPTEYYLKLIRQLHLTAESAKSSLDEIKAKSKTSNGVSSVKVMSNTIKSTGNILKLSKIVNDTDSEDAFFNYYKNAFFIRVTRYDKIAQAVSRVLAAKTDVYHSMISDNEFRASLGKYVIDKEISYKGIDYDHDEIKKQIDSIKKEESYMDQCLIKHNVSPFNVIYEDAINDRSYIAKIGEMLNIDKISLSDRRLAKVTGVIGPQWAQMYKNE